MKQFRNGLDALLEHFLCALLIIMVLFSMWQVLSRYLFNSPSVVSEEFLRFSLIWLSIMAAAYVAGKSKHVSFSLLFDSLSAQGQRRLAILVQIIFILFAAVVMVYGGIKAMSTSMTQLSPVLNVPMGLVYSVLPISGVLICLYCSLNIEDLYRYQHAEIKDVREMAASQRSENEESL
jgi:TRAP-type C4-dicarboxylate transport system permease small subunit